MKNVAELNQELTECAEDLSQCAYHLHKLGLLKEEKALLKLGRAIAEINEVRSGLYRLHPELKPELWDTPPTDDHYAAWFEEAKEVAAGYRAENNPAMELETYESFLSIGPSEPTASLVRQEIAKIKQQHGI
jgi:predicted component of type VI protein secretion system